MAEFDPLCNCEPPVRGWCTDCGEAIDDAVEAQMNAFIARYDAQQDEEGQAA